MSKHQDKTVTIVIFVFTEWGEILLLRNSAAESSLQNRWSVLENDVSKNSSHEDTALQEISKRLKFRGDPSFLKILFPNSSHDTTEKIIYAYTLSWEQYQVIQYLRTQLVQRITPDGLSDQEVIESRIRFITIKELFADIQVFPARYNPSLLNLLRKPTVEKTIMSFWSALVSQTRTKVIKLISKARQKALNSDPTLTMVSVEEQDGDSLIINSVLPQTEKPAAEFEVQRIFTLGKQTCPGAYRIGEMTAFAGHMDRWNKKLSDPYHRYVEEEIELLRRGVRDSEYKEEIDSIDVGDACCFIRNVLHFPLEDGTLVRSGLGNLQEIAAGRRALRLYLQSQTKLPKERIGNPIKQYSQMCNNIVREVWDSLGWNLSKTTDEILHKLLRLNVLLNTLDFKNMDFLNVWSDPDQFRNFVEAQFEAASNNKFTPKLGGDTFVQEFLKKWISPDRVAPVSLVYLTDNNGQLAISLKCVEAFLKRCPSLRITLVPKNGQFGNDTSWQDVEEFLDFDKKSSSQIFSEFHEYLGNRLIICRNGPSSEGLDPGNLSRDFCNHLNKADVIIAEGRAYAQIRGWRKPTYLIFPVKGRVAEALHGIAGHTNAPAFVRVGNGIPHFSHLHQISMHTIVSEGKSFNSYGQTTADYTKAINSDNYRILRDQLFGGKEETLLGRLQQESLYTKRTISEIVLGTIDPPGPEQTKRYRTAIPVDVFAIGGGGGFNQVTLKALQRLNVRVMAGVPSTDDGGSTGKLQKMISEHYGYMFGMGDAAAILEQQTNCEFKKLLLSFRPPGKADSLKDILVKTVHRLMEISSTPIACPDFLSFISEQLNLARVIDTFFIGNKNVPSFSIEKASIRNLNILASFYMCEALQNINKVYDEKRADCAWFLLENALGIRQGCQNTIRVVPATYGQAILRAKYNKPVPKKQKNEFQTIYIPDSALSMDRKTVYGQQYIDQLITSGSIIDFGLVHSTKKQEPLPQASKTYLTGLRSARLIIVGAGSLFSSQLAQLAVPGVMDEIIQRKDIRRILVLNHVRLNETANFSLRDHIKVIEKLANNVISQKLKNQMKKKVRIGDIFTDIVVPKTVAREIDQALEKKKDHSSESVNYPTWRKLKDPQYVMPDNSPSDSKKGILRNRYVGFALDHPDFRQQEQITDWELQVLGFLEQPPVLYNKRSEAGRYRGAVYATEQDFRYLVNRGIPRRHIYEVESIAMNKKYLKASGLNQVEIFPGLIPESLVGIFRILLEKGQYKSSESVKTVE